MLAVPLDAKIVETALPISNVDMKVQHSKKMASDIARSATWPKNSPLYHLALPDKPIFLIESHNCALGPPAFTWIRSPTINGDH
jgi:hypothetical protein